MLECGCRWRRWDGLAACAHSPVEAAPATARRGVGDGRQPPRRVGRSRAVEPEADAPSRGDDDNRGFLAAHARRPPAPSSSWGCRRACWHRDDGRRWRRDDARRPWHQPPPGHAQPADHRRRHRVGLVLEPAVPVVASAPHRVATVHPDVAGLASTARGCGRVRAARRTARRRAVLQVARPAGADGLPPHVGVNLRVAVVGAAAQWAAAPTEPHRQRLRRIALHGCKRLTRIALYGRHNGSSDAGRPRLGDGSVKHAQLTLSCCYE